MKMGQKVMYGDSKYVVVRADRSSCDFITEEYAQMYVTSGADSGNSILKIFNAPDGSTVVTDYKGDTQGFLGMSIRGITTLDEQPMKLYTTIHAEEIII